MKPKWVENDSGGIGPPCEPYPGVYAIMFDAKVLYVGSSGNIQRRILRHMKSYKCSFRVNKWGDMSFHHSLFGLPIGKTGVENKYAVSYKYSIDYSDRASLYRRELRLIGKLRPPLNKHGVHSK